MPELTIVLPCFNESGNLPDLLRAYRELYQRMTFDLILVDNGSTDGTARWLEVELGRAENHFARQVRVPQNIGYGHGIQEGLRASASPLVAFSHADLQCKPEDLFTALSLYRSLPQTAPSLIKGRRGGRRARLDRIVTWIYNHMAAWLLGFRTQEGRVADINAEPKLFPRALVPDLLKGPAGFTFDLYALAVAHQRGCRLVEFDVVYNARGWGRSKLAANPWVRFKTSLKALLYIFKLAYEA